MLTFKSSYIKSIKNNSFANTNAAISENNDNYRLRIQRQILSKINHKIYRINYMAFFLKTSTSKCNYYRVKTTLAREAESLMLYQLQNSFHIPNWHLKKIPFWSIHQNLQCFFCGGEIFLYPYLSIIFKKNKTTGSCQQSISIIGFICCHYSHFEFKNMYNCNFSLSHCRQFFGKKWLPGAIFKY